MGYGADEQDALGATNDATQGASMGMMAGPYGAAAGAGLGLLKYFALDRPNQQRKLALAATSARLAPWLQDGQKVNPWSALSGNQMDPTKDVLQTAMLGGGLQQSYNKYQQDQALKKAQANYMNPWGTLGQSGSAPQLYFPQADGFSYNGKLGSFGG